MASPSATPWPDLGTALPPSTPARKLAPPMPRTPQVPPSHRSFHSFMFLETLRSYTATSLPFLGRLLRFINSLPSARPYYVSLASVRCAKTTWLCVFFAFSRAARGVVGQSLRMRAGASAAQVAPDAAAGFGRVRNSPIHSTSTICHPKLHLRNLSYTAFTIHNTAPAEMHCTRQRGARGPAALMMAVAAWVLLALSCAEAQTTPPPNRAQYGESDIGALMQMPCEQRADGIN